MAQTDTYANLILLIGARMGASFGDVELARIKALINSRARLAVRESDYWDNFLVIGEERAVDGSTNVVPYTGAVYDVSSASDPYAGPVDRFLRIHKVKPWDTRSSQEYEFAGVGAGARLISYADSYGLSAAISAATATSGTVVVRTASTMVDYYVGGGIQVEGCDTDVVDINGTHTVTAVSTAAYTAGYTEVTYSITDTTNNTFSISGDETMKTPSVFCTYKKRLATAYGDGVGESTSVPIEWFEYIAHGVFADMLRSDHQYEAAAMEDRSAVFALELELERLDAQHAIQTVGQSIFTHLSEQGRAVNY